MYTPLHRSSRQGSLNVPYTVTSLSPSGGKSIFDYDIDTKTSTTFEPGNISHTPSIPLVTMTDVHRHSTHSSRSGSFSSIDPNELAYANMNNNNEAGKFDDPVYERIKGEKEDIAENPLYDDMMSTNL